MSAAFRCPKCRGGDFMITEAVIVDDWIEVANGRVVDRGRGDWAGSLGFTGECRCGHRWHLKNKTGQAAAEAAARNTSGAHPGGNHDT